MRCQSVTRLQLHNDRTLLVPSLVEIEKWRDFLLTQPAAPPASGAEDYAMQDSSTDATTILRFRQDLQRRLRDRIREAIETTL